MEDVMGSFNDGLKAHALKAISAFYLVGRRLGIPAWSDEHRRFLNFCIDENILSQEELEKAATARIIQLGRESYERHIDADVLPDHTASPQALAYAIRLGGLTDAEVDRIKFDHGETRYTFCRGVEDTLVEEVVKHLRNPPQEWPA
jgi:hypothetical protein